MPKKLPPMPEVGSLKMRKQLSVPGLLKSVREAFMQVEDPRKQGVSYPLTDVLMSGLAMFGLKDESLLAFDKLRHDECRQHNLRTLYGIKNAPSDSAMREVLDEVDSQALRPAFKDLLQLMQQQGELQNFRFLGKYLVSLDGTGVFSSGTVSCPECCSKQHKNGDVTYYHQMLAAAIVHPERKTVLPLYPEAITRQDGETKNDCEHNASKRLIPALCQDFPRLEMIVLQDALACNGPHLRMLKEHGLSFIITSKPAAGSMLLKAVLAGLDTGKTREVEWKNGKELACGARFANSVPLNGEHRDLHVNFIDYWEEKKDGTMYHYACVTDIELTADNVADVVRAGRSRWKIENETFNTLKNQGYNLEHNYGHGKRHLASVFGSLTMLAFLVDQIQETCCRYFQAARDRYGSRRMLWEFMRSYFRTFKIESWEILFGSIIWGHDRQQLQVVGCRSG